MKRGTLLVTYGFLITVALTLALQSFAMSQDAGVRPALVKFQVLYSFQGGADGAGPVAALVADGAGNLYGTAEYGGDGNGVVFKVDASGKETVLYSFKGGTDGANPTGALARDAAGNLYGTTLNGAGSGCGPLDGCGTVFKLDATGKETVLYRFTGGTNGTAPFAGLIRDKDGNLYGTTTAGGGSGCGGSGCGTVFKVDAAGEETVLHRFAGGKDGSNPQASVIRDAQGNLYGTTLQGGGSGCNDNAGCGTVYKLNTAGKEQVLHRFTGGDGGWPWSLTRDAGGNLYGTASIGGRSGAGTVFKLSPTGKITTLYSFTGRADGASPTGGVILDRAGNLYGTADQGGNSCGNLSCGTVFRLDTTLKFSVLHRFIGGDGEFPIAGLVRDRAGNLYGTTIDGGSVNSGVVFKLTP